MSLDSEIQKAAESLAKYHEKLEKSKNTGDVTMQDLIKQIKEMGPEGLKKALPNLTKKQKDVLQNVLRKAVDLREEAWGDDNENPQQAREPVTEKVSNDPEGVDEWDEELMDELNRTHRNQGGTGKDGAWEGQVIKGKGECGTEEHKQHHKELDKLLEEEKKEHKEKEKTEKGQMPAYHFGKGGEEKEKQKKRMKQYNKERADEPPKNLQDFSDEKLKDQAAMAGASKEYQQGLDEKNIQKSMAGDAQEGSRHAADLKMDQEPSRRSKFRGEASPISTSGYKYDYEQHEPLSGEGEHGSEDYKDVKVDSAGAKEKMGKSKEEMEKKQGVPEGVDSAKHERCVQDLKDQGHDKESSIRICNDSLQGKTQKSEQEEHDLEKGDMLKKMVKRMKDRGMDKAKCMDAMKKKGYDTKKAQEMWDAEEEEAEMDKGRGKDKAPRKRRGSGGSSNMRTADAMTEAAKQQGLVKGMSVEEAVKKIMTDKYEVNDVIKEMPKEKQDDVLRQLREKKGEKTQKAIIWNDPQRELLGATARNGRNAHYEVGDEIVKSEKQYEEFKKSDSLFLGYNPEEKMEKSENKGFDINDELENGRDMSQDKISLAKANVQAKPQGGYNVKSFQEEEVAKALRLSEEDAKKILGKEEPDSNQDK